MSTFRRPVQVIRRLPGGYVDGIYQPAPLPSSSMVMMGVQPATAADYDEVEAMPSGRRVGEMRRGYTTVADALVPAGQDGLPGDLVLTDAAAWLVIGVSKRDVLQTAVSHSRHLLVRQDINDVAEAMPGGALYPASFRRAGAVSLAFDGGIPVENGTYFIIPSAAYPVMLDQLEYEIGSGGGSFIVDFSHATPGSAAIPIAGLTAITVSNAAQQIATPASQVIVPAGGRVIAEISNRIGVPTGAVLTLYYLR